MQNQNQNQNQDTTQLKRYSTSVTLYLVGGFLLANGFGLSAVAIGGVFALTAGTLVATRATIEVCRNKKKISDKTANKLIALVGGASRGQSPLTSGVDVVDKGLNLTPANVSQQYINSLPAVQVEIGNLTPAEIKEANNTLGSLVTKQTKPHKSPPISNAKISIV